MPATTQQSGDGATPSLKGKSFREFYEYLLSTTATATMVAAALSIYRPSACRYKRWLEKDGHLFEIKKGTCAVTGFRATYLSTDPSKKPISPQQKLF